MTTTSFPRSAWERTLGRSAATSLGLALAAALCASASAADVNKKPRTIIPTEGLVLKNPGKSYGRVPIHEDPVELELITGRWKVPRAGDQVMSAGGTLLTWEKVTLNKDGQVQHPALAGGYLYVPIEVSEPRIWLLEAVGHGLVYVNGELRVGDIYSSGIVSLPVSLHKGVNHFLFQGGRGTVRVKLVEPGSEPVFVNVRDVILPDLKEGEQAPDHWGSIVITNASDSMAHPRLIFARLSTPFGTSTAIPNLLPLSSRSIAFRWETAQGWRPEPANKLKLEIARGPELLLDVRVRTVDQTYKRTFRSRIDGSVQYYAVNPAKNKHKAGLVLSLHGASVEGIGQADAYGAKDWCHIVAPTNRRPFGFDWEDWGRLDALEVLEHAQRELKTDPAQTYLTGHSMGGHGTWHVGVTYPDRFAAIAPSAGWVSFWTYGSGPKPKPATPIQELIQRPHNGSDTPLLACNTLNHGVYVLHGDADDNVPVGQARQMKGILDKFHPDFVYHEQPKAGHWWGNACVDWPPLFDFLKRHTLAKPADVNDLEFVTANPGVSAWCHWAGIEGQTRPLQISSFALKQDLTQRRIAGKTVNVARLGLKLNHWKYGPITVELDGQELKDLPYPLDGKKRLWLERKGNRWELAKKPSPTDKVSRRYGPFRDAFRNRMIFVYGTQGTPDENAWALAKARYDAEVFWYRGNGSIDVVTDREFDPAKEKDRNVILYGNAQTNACWQPLLKDSPMQVNRKQITVGSKKWEGDDLCCLFLRPRPGSDTACVAAVAGTGMFGARLTDRLPIFVSGIAYPDCLVLGTDMLTKGYGGVRAAGYFGPDWSVEKGEFAWGQ